MTKYENCNNTLYFGYLLHLFIIYHYTLSTKQLKYCVCNLNLKVSLVMTPSGCSFIKLSYIANSAFVYVAFVFSPNFSPAPRSKLSLLLNVFPMVCALDDDY